MTYHIYQTEEQIGKAAALLFASQVIQKPDSVLGFATGSTPIPTYQQMIRLYEDGIVDFSRVTSYNLDEYCGLSPDHDQSYHYFMMHNLFQHINIPAQSIHLPDGLAKDTDACCAAYEAAIQQSGGIDLQILGLGINGHIGFNEPDDCFWLPTHQVKLTASTIEANKRFFASADDVPRYALTMGIGTIMRSRAVLLIATGKAKAEAVRKMIKANPTPDCPASVLQMHPNVTVLLNREAAALL